MVLKIGAITLGCDKNQVDTEKMLGSLRGLDFIYVPNPEAADVIVINTCCFIDAAKEESINTILEIVNFKQTNSNLKIIVAGCMVQKYASELMQEIPEIDAFLGTAQIDKMRDVLDHFQNNKDDQFISIKDTPAEEDIFFERFPTFTHTAYLKIAEGCSNHCTYCVIPQVRGPYRSKWMENIIREAQNLVANGAKEICLIAQDITMYGRDLYGELKLVELLERLVQIEELKWIRLFYCYPTYFTDQLIEVVKKYDKICNYFDIPLQHADNRILQCMGRHGNREFIETLIGKLRYTIPDVVLRTTFIVGFPGETEKEFEQLLDFVKRIQFQWAGVFTYSQEPETPAGRMLEQVSVKIKEERFHRAMLLQKEITLRQNQRWVGKKLEILVDQKSDTDLGMYVGRSQYQAPEVDGVVYFSSELNLNPGDFVIVKILRVDEYDLIGEMVNESG